MRPCSLIVALTVVLLPTLAGAKGIKLAKVGCVWVKEAIVLPLKGYRYEAGKFRCTAKVTVDKKTTEADVVVTLRLLQKPESAGGNEERGKATQKASLWPGFKGEVEAELAPSDGLNGCMPFTLVVELAGQTKKVEAKPTCGD